jgi:hypothetical protein
LGGILNKVDANIQITKISPPVLADENTLALALSEEEIEILYNKIVLPKKIREKIPQRDKTTQAKPGKSERCEFPDFIV